jgi:hypothetical protein
MSHATLTSLPRRWFSDGATMNYPRRSRNLFWASNLCLFIMLNVFDLRMRTGQWMPSSKSLATPQPLIDILLSPLSVFQYPSQILVVGMLMALICTVPILTALLYNLWYSLPFIFAVLIIGSNPILALCLFVSCAAVSFDPLRFKSKFVAALLWLAPEVLYWTLFSGDYPEQDALRWAVLYAPWALAFFNCLFIYGLVIGIGHFLRYRPGLLMPLFGLLLAGTVTFFHFTIGMNERDFQDKVYRNSPQKVAAFQSKSILPLVEEEAAIRLEKQSNLNPETVKDEIRMGLRLHFKVGPNKNREVIAYHQARYWAINSMRSFITENRNKSDKRIPDTFYYLGLLYDLNVDLRALWDQDTLRFYHSRPVFDTETNDAWYELIHNYETYKLNLLSMNLNGVPENSRHYWQAILSEYGQSDVSVEARWRIAYLMSTRPPSDPSDTYPFDHALELLAQARTQCETLLEIRRQQQSEETFWERHLGEIIRRPAETLTESDLVGLLQRIGDLARILNEENRTGHASQEERLARFISLDPHHLLFEENLKELKDSSQPPDPLMDNIELELAMLSSNRDERRSRLKDLAERYEKQDGGMEAMLELAKLMIEDRKRSVHLADRQELLSEAQKYLRHIVSGRSGSIMAQQAMILLNNNPIE